ncbi:MAG: acyl-[ACP]--phospholipid O-acyltransferase [Gammaproteobacteria bacterium]|nr:acyl-[ACP]--phospholipid O-acyltransferase [Gammaproteobacteria bacterium]
MLDVLKIRGFLPFIGMVFLNAFVDLGHKIIVQNTVFKAYDGDTLIILTGIINGLILLPFVLLFSPAGFVSDRFAKTTVMRLSAWLAVALTLLITYSYYQGDFHVAFAMTFILAMQSAIYSPAKYGYIKDLAGTKKLAEANGVVQVGTTVAILLGTFVFSILFEYRLEDFTKMDEPSILAKIAPIGWFLVAGSILELVLAYRLPISKPVADGLRFEWGSYLRGLYLRGNLKLIWRHEIIWLSIVGLSVFWAIAQVVLAGFPAFTKSEMGITNTVVIQGLMACSGFGILAGSSMACKVSKNHIETGLIPVGAVGVAATIIVLPALPGPVSLGLNFLALGFLGGLFIVPLNALIQYHAKESERGRVLAGNNLVQNTTMLIFLTMTVALAKAGADSRFLFAVLAVAAVIGAAYTLYKVPQSLVRFIVNQILASKYRLQIVGFENFPETGGVLLLGNHISWIDWAVVQMSSPRPVRFIMERSIYERWYLKWFLDFFGCIPISAGQYQKALERVAELLNQGEVVCLFPEGTISRNGQLCEFKHGYEKAAANAQGVIVPLYLRGLWGSSFSHSNAGFRAHRRSSRKREIVVAFGEPLSMQTKADVLKQKVFELSISAWNQYTESLPNVAAAWFATAKRLGSNIAITDSSGTALSHRRVAAGVLFVSTAIRKECRDRNIGVLLPPSSAGAIANLAVLNCGRTVVNLNYTASPDNLRSSVDNAEIKYIITSRKFLERLETRGISLEALASVVSFIYLEEVMAAPSNTAKFLIMMLITVLPHSVLLRLFHQRTAIDAPAAILFSSGSEGTPKGVVLSHKNIMSNIRQISDVLNTESNDVVMATLPLFHAFGLTVTTLMPLVEGIPMVTHPDPTDGVNIGKAVAKSRATILFGTSTFFRLYTKNSRVLPLMFESLRIVIAGAERLSADVRDAFKLKFNKSILEGYGATETTPVASVNIPDELDVWNWKVQCGARNGTVGMPLPGTSFRIVDPETLKSLPRNEDGLILIGGNQVMQGYLNDEDRTTHAIVTLDDMRWYKTGDKGHIDEDGFLTIVDRYSRFAKIGGEMVSLTAVEDSVRAALQPAEIECVAVSVPDAKKGESIVLLISPTGLESNDPDAIQKRILDYGISPMMTPARVEVVPQIPMLASGKADFSAARELALAAAS